MDTQAGHRHRSDCGTPLRREMAQRLAAYRTCLGQCARAAGHLDPNDAARRRRDRQPGGLPVTSLARTAFDVARRGPFSAAIERLDALGNATIVDCAEVKEIAVRHRGVRGIRQLFRVLESHDPGAQSPKETWLRMLVVRAGFPRPRTQIAVRSSVSGRQYFLDLGWEELRLALEYDGDHHRTERSQFARDIVRLEELAASGWTVLRVAADTPPRDVIDRLHRAWTASTLR